MRDRHDRLGSRGHDKDAFRPDRRQVLSLGLGAFVVASIPLAMRNRPQGELVRRRVPVMGTVADLAVRTRSAEVGRTGRTALLYRPDPETPRIEIPRD